MKYKAVKSGKLIVNGKELVVTRGEFVSKTEFVEMFPSYFIEETKIVETIEPKEEILTEVSSDVKVEIEETKESKEDEKPTKKKRSRRK